MTTQTSVPIQTVHGVSYPYVGATAENQSSKNRDCTKQDPGDRMASRASVKSSTSTNSK
ncbi:hypothetical protein SAMN06265222_110117 [Neorhodopirellula lusitana]|uniref:Uncharacterized protein n=1 Tax=Neorhodopirellula lusitana TaxID=445327 RepID=A0ABY1QCU5_9BACT|nr:hypothetical protein [Neorhodopirellula lusitana]SMP67220.1 hypothetical protein SAMN06265222_110117 [Neorhodopirellula lusitana]